MGGSNHNLKSAESVKEHSRRKGSSANRYEHEHRHDRVQGRLSAGKAGALANRSSRNLKGGYSGVSHLSKEVLREGGRLKAIKTTAAVTTPLAAGTIVGAVAVGFYGIANMLRYKRNEKSAVRAAKDTITGSAGVGISTGLGVAAANAVVGTFGSMVVVPVAAGAVTAYLSMAVWDKLFFAGKVAAKAS